MKAGKRNTYLIVYNKLLSIFTSPLYGIKFYATVRRIIGKHVNGVLYLEPEEDTTVISKGKGDELTSENFLNTFLSNGVSGYRLRENYGGVEIFYKRKRNNNISHVIYFHNKTEEFTLSYIKTVS